MNYKIADAKTRYFNDQQHYQDFRKSWARAVNSVNCKATKNKFYGNKESGWLTNSHMLLYAILRGKDASSAFTPVTNETKLQNGTYVNRGMYEAYYGLWRLSLKHQADRIPEFLTPFNGTIDPEVLLKVINDLPVIEPIYDRGQPNNVEPLTTTAPIKTIPLIRKKQCRFFGQVWYDYIFRRKQWRKAKNLPQS